MNNQTQARTTNQPPQRQPPAPPAQPVATALALLNDPSLHRKAAALRLLAPPYQKVKRDGSPLYSDADMIGLALAAEATGLRPQEGELFCIPNVGTQPATKVVVGAAIQAAREQGEYLHIDFTDCYETMPEFADAGAAKGDTVRMLLATSSKWALEWQAQRRAFTDELKLAGFEPKEILGTVDERFGRKPPELRIVGMVRASEKVDGDGKTITDNPKFGWKDRADKRALKKFITKHGYAVTGQMRDMMNAVKEVNQALGHDDAGDDATVIEGTAEDVTTETIG